MKEIELISGKYCLIELPEDNIDVVVNRFEDINRTVITVIMDENDDDKDLLKTINGLYELVGYGDKLSEQQWSRIVEKYDEHCVNCCWPDYTREEIFANRYVLDTATESGHSLIKSNNLNPQTTLILKLQQ